MSNESNASDEPSSSAGASAHTAADVLVDEGAVPPAPTLSVAFVTVVWGVIVAFMACVFAVAVSIRFFSALPDAVDLAGSTTFAIGSGVIELIALASWWSALKSRDADPWRWSSLVVPFFVVVGAAGGVVIFRGAHDPERWQPQEWRSSSACVRALGYESDSDPAFLACLDVGRRCQEEILATTNRRADVDACVQERAKK